jgi:hypothetical protein
MKSPIESGRGALLLREAGKVVLSAGWGTESSNPSMGSFAMTLVQAGLSFMQRPTPHPALRATFPSRAGEGELEAYFPDMILSKIGALSFS